MGGHPSLFEKPPPVASPSDDRRQPLYGLLPVVPLALYPSNEVKTENPLTRMIIEKALFPARNTATTPFEDDESNYSFHLSTILFVELLNRFLLNICTLYPFFLFCNQFIIYKIIPMTSPVKFSTVPPLASDKDEDYTFSQTDKCSLFLCQGGELDIVLEDKTYHVHQGDIYISPLLMSIQIKHRSKDLKGIMLTVDIDYILTNRKKHSIPLGVFASTKIHVCRCRKNNICT